MIKDTILDTYSKAARRSESNLCCGVNYREEFRPEELDHIPEQVLERNYGCGVPAGLRALRGGEQVLDLGPGFGRDCFVAARKVGPEGQVFGLDMNDDMLRQANHFRQEVVRRLGYDNVRFIKGQFDVRIPLPDGSIDVILSNCVNNLAEDKPTAYREMFRVLKPGSKISFSDVVAYRPLPDLLRRNERAWADCVAGVLSFQELKDRLRQAGFHGLSLTAGYLWKGGAQVLDEYFNADRLTDPERTRLAAVRLYSVVVEAFKPVVDPAGACYWKGQYALFHGPGQALQLDDDPDHLFQAGTLKEVCEKTATILKSEPFSRSFTVFEPEGEVEFRPCPPGDTCC